MSISDFSLGLEESLFLKGPSGSGKTTFLNLLSGVLIPQAGQIEILDQNISAFSRGKKDSFRGDHMGFIFQMFNLVPYLSVAENILLPAKFSKLRRARAHQKSGSLEKEVKRLMQALQIEEAESSPASQLSVGQQQRVAAARAFFGSPELIIADEPTSSLDEDRKNNFVKLLMKQSKETRATCLFVSHDQSLAKHFDQSLEMKAWRK